MAVLLLACIPIRLKMEPGQGFESTRALAFDRESTLKLSQQTQRPKAGGLAFPVDNDATMRLVATVGVMAAAVLLIRRRPGEMDERMQTPQVRWKHRQMQQHFLSDLYTQWTAFSNNHPNMTRLTAFDVIVDEVKRSPDYFELSIPERVELEEVIERYRRRLVRSLILQVREVRKEPVFNEEKGTSEAFA